MTKTIKDGIKVTVGIVGLLLCMNSGAWFPWLNMVGLAAFMVVMTNYDW